MYDLIQQIENAAAGSITEEIRLIKQRRKSLVHIIKFTLSINRLQQSLESALLLKKPTKDIPRKLLNVLGAISENITNLPSNELMKRLIRIEDSIKNDMNSIMGISKQPDKIDASNSNNPKNTSDKLQLLINDFRRRINTALVLKLHLRSRGMNINETTIPITAEELVTQISKLAFKEKKCLTKTKNELQAMNEQMEIILNSENHPTSMKQYARELRQQINKNIEHINKGKDIEKMPFVVEIIQIGEDANESSNTTNHSTRQEENIVTVEDTVTPPDDKKLSFINKLQKWLSTSWGVKWKDIK